MFYTHFFKLCFTKDFIEIPFNCLTYFRFEMKHSTLSIFLLAKILLCTDKNINKKRFISVWRCLRAIAKTSTTVLNKHGHLGGWTATLINSVWMCSRSIFSSPSSHLKFLAQPSYRTPNAFLEKLREKSLMMATVTMVMTPNLQHDVSVYHTGQHRNRLSEGCMMAHFLYIWSKLRQPHQTRTIRSDDWKKLKLQLSWINWLTAEYFCV